MSNQLSTGQHLTPGQSIFSPSGEFRLTYQSDGNAVIYSTLSGQPIWSINLGTSSPKELIMQTDGNLVCYDQTGTPYWSSNTSGSNHRLELHDDGMACMYDQRNAGHWATSIRVCAGNNVFDPAQHGLDPAHFPYELVAMWVPLFWYTDDAGSKANKDIVFARPMRFPGWYFLGQFARDDHQSDLTGYGAILVQPVKGKYPLAFPNGFSRRWGVRQDDFLYDLRNISIVVGHALTTIASTLTFGAIADVALELIDQQIPDYPKKYEIIAGSMSSPFHGKRMGLYTPNSPSGFSNYVGISDVWENTDEQHDLQFPDYACVRQDLVKPSGFGWFLWDDHGSGAQDDGSVYGFFDPKLVKIPNGKNTFFPFKAFSGYPNSQEIGNANTLDWEKVYFLN